MTLTSRTVASLVLVALVTAGVQASTFRSDFEKDLDGWTALRQTWRWANRDSLATIVPPLSRDGFAVLDKEASDELLSPELGAPEGGTFSMTFFLRSVLEGSNTLIVSYVANEEVFEILNLNDFALPNNTEWVSVSADIPPVQDPIRLEVFCFNSNEAPAGEVILGCVLDEIVIEINGESTEAPTEVPTETPTAEPTEPETDAPTEEPTDGPTAEPTDAPTEEPTDGPTEEPTDAPTDEPTDGPTEEPTDGPTEEPTDAPTEEPTDGPTEEPTDAPTEEPTDAPTEEPTDAPTEEPTDGPTEEPTDGPTEEPTEGPTEEPTDGPTEEPTDAPTEEPTDGPTEEPTDGPTEEPTDGPTEEPTDGPTEEPTDGPTEEPTDGPTEEPTDGPTDEPTDGPTEEPTDGPTEEPTDGPTEEPTDGPTDEPTDGPTEEPTDGPTEEPTDAPTEEPTDAPTEEPTDAPTEEPTDGPTEEPTDGPTEEPTDGPTEEPTDTPTDEPTDVPTEEPTDAPTEEPTDFPTETTDAPTEEPTETPTDTPTDAPDDSLFYTFETGVEGWTLGHMNGASWRRRIFESNGQTVGDPPHGPWVLQVEPLEIMDGTVIAQSPLFEATDEKMNLMVTFWMDGSVDFQAELKVRRKNDFLSYDVTPIMNLDPYGDQENYLWITYRAVVDGLSPGETFSLVLEGSLGGHPNNSVAVDMVALEGVKEVPLGQTSFDFEDGLVGWSAGNMDGGRWVLKTWSEMDPSLNIPQPPSGEKFLFVERFDIHSGIITVETPVLTLVPGTRQALWIKFWTRGSVVYPATLRIRKKSPDGLYDPVPLINLRKYGDTDNTDWTSYGQHFLIPADTMETAYQLVIEADLGSDPKNLVALDDLSLTTVW